MHHSRLGGLIIDCDTDDLDREASFWSAALGYPIRPSQDPDDDGYVILDTPDGEWDALLTVNGEVTRAMTAYSYFGNAEAPKGFVVALLGEDRSETLVFQDGGKDWLEYGDYQYDKCN